MNEELALKVVKSESQKQTAYRIAELYECIAKLEEEKEELITLIDGASVCVELFNSEGEYNKIWKIKWLEKARSIIVDYVDNNSSLTYGGFHLCKKCHRVIKSDKCGYCGHVD